MGNQEIIRLFRLTAQLLELHGENDFKIRTYTNVVLTMEDMREEYADIKDDPSKLQGIGKTFIEKIKEAETTGSFNELRQLLDKTPEGLIEMFSIKGLGAKKIKILWQEHNITDTEKLLKACEENTLAQLKGFGEKTQESIKQSLLFKKKSLGKLLYASAEKIVATIEAELIKHGLFSAITGEFARQNEIIHSLKWVVGVKDGLKNSHQIIDQIPFIKKDAKATSPFTWKGTFQNFPVEFLLEPIEKVKTQAFIFSAADGHLKFINAESHSLLKIAVSGGHNSEEEIYEKAGLPFIPAALREGTNEINWSTSGKLANLVELKDLKGILHNHSTYSDGRHSLEEMAVHCKNSGFEYLGISDHSKTVIYANGLQEFRIEKQHQEIEELNKKLAPFKIFKGIESDILNDGSLDYEDEILKTFDFIVASIHSNLGMDEEKATQRLITAIENPYTTILGHPTGRLLLKREGYPINHHKIIDACAANGVVIEINANPLRLDMDWRYIDYAQEKGVMLSINPDAHEMEGYEDMKYGVIVARKGGLIKNMTFNALTLKEMEEYLLNRKQTRHKK